MRLLICAGGTGGGVYPALAVLQTLGKDVDSVLWVGGEGGMEAEMINRLHIPYAAIPAAGVHGVGLTALPANIIRLVRGIFKSRHILSNFTPDVLLFTGGFVAVPMAIAGTKYPSLLYVPDIEPGLAIKAIARFSDRIAVTVKETGHFFANRHPVDVTGYPTRNDLAKWNRENSREHFALHNHKPVILVFGGSKGARSINNALLNNLEQLLSKAQILHVTGEANYAEASQVKVNLSINQSDYHPYPFLHDDMGAAFAVADLAVCRSGASILGELPLFGLPAILVPYPHAWNYQKINAEYLVQNGGAVIVIDQNLDSDLTETITSLLSNPAKLEKMRENIRQMSAPQAAQNLARILCELGSPGKKEPFSD